MILYHGSSCIVENPDLNHSRVAIDFGEGFYLTEDERMAKKWAVGKKKAIVNKYEINLNDLSVYTFNLDREWLDYVSGNRLLSDTGKYREYDVLIGATADDTLYDSLREYLDGIMTAAETIKVLNVLGFSNQIVLKTDKAINALAFLGAKELKGLELAQYRNYIISDRIAASEKTLELKKSFAVEREKIEDLGDEYER